MLSQLEQTSDWKSRYQDALGELEAREREWRAIEELLRKTIGRLAIAGRGLDQRLDRQLLEIQELSREKRDEKLAEALARLSEIITALDDPKPGGKSRRSDPIMLMLELLQGIHFNIDQRAHLREICSELLKSVAGGHDREKISTYVQQLAALINENFDNVDQDRSVAVVMRLLDLLELEPACSLQVQEKFAHLENFEEAELQNLARMLNLQLVGKPDDSSIDEVMTTLLERLAIVQGNDGSAQAIQTRIHENGEENWADTLNDIVNSVSASLKRLDSEKKELEAFIVHVTTQLGEITESVADGHRDHCSDHEDAQSLHNFVEDGMALIQKNFQSASDLHELKASIADNITQIRDGVETFVERFHERHEATEERNLRLTEQLSKMEQETQELQVMLNENREKLLYDSLTGVHSRMAYDERIVQELARWDRYQTPFSYAILDIDHFKHINDSFGHNAGDKALKIVAQMMLQYVRQSDYVFRIGGEEFVLLLTNTPAADAAGMIEKLRAGIASSAIHFKGEPANLTLSAGITETRPDDNFESIYERADNALYRAKHSGRNCQFIAD
ncbi:MAG: GGDEF domain-containing protein [Gammaproteobacteria bacterium]|nr:GGDEF domain-containing protein [Gammaproteobacteria bacterium]